MGNYNGQISTCRKCGAQILFIRMKSWKSMPVNTHFVHYKLGGKDKIVLNNGEVVSGTIVSAQEESDGYGYISHFATCEYANMFRKKRK
jgi:hypothetical protein